MKTTKSYLTLKVSLVSMILVILLFLFSGLLITPSFTDVQNLSRGSDQYLVDNTDEIIQRIRIDFNKRQISWLPLTSYSKILKETLISIEDKRFYSHIGIDPIAFGRAIRDMVLGQRRQGASTLTMQLSDLIRKDVMADNKKIKKGSLWNKIKQVHGALAIDLLWSKDEILEAYLNLIHLRSEYQGVQAFTYAYLNKSPLFLSKEESTLITTLIRKPNMSYTKFKKITCKNGEKLYSDFNCTVSDRIINQLSKSKPNLENPYDWAFHFARKVFNENKGTSVIKSYIDFNVQKKLYSILEKNLSYLQNNKVTDMAGVVIENKTGKVIAYVGTIDKFSEAKNVDGADSPRQAGSTLKPFLYGHAIDKKYLTAGSLIKDEPMTLSWKGGTYRPTNYDQKFHGTVSARQALASSLNIPAIKVVKMIGLQDSYNIIQSLNFSALRSPDHYGASLALGAAEVKLHELANSYRALANGGRLRPLQWFEGQTNTSEEVQILSEDAAYILSDILSDPNARRMGFGWNSALETGFWTAVKTGTSKGLRDNWCVGYSQDYTVAIWAGNFSADLMKSVSGVSGAAPSWFEMMSFLHKEKKSLAPKKPDNVIATSVKFDWSPTKQTEYFIKGTEPQSQKITEAPNETIAITFPANGATLALQPHRGQKKQNLFVRYKGTPPGESKIYLNNILLGDLSNPFKVEDIKRGTFHLVIKKADGSLLDESYFEVK